MIELIIKLLGQLFGAIIGLVVLLIKALFSNVLLVIANIGFTFLDFIQAMFRRLAGLPMEGRENPDIVQNLINSEIVRNTIIALTILAVCLLFIATFVQLARVEFTEEGAKNSKTPIITQALKAFAMFVIVPVTCMLGVFMSNLVLKMVDSATSGGNSKTISGLIFKVGAYDANIIRNEGVGSVIIPTPYAPQYIGLWIADMLLFGMDAIAGGLVDTETDWRSAYAVVDSDGNLNAKSVAILPSTISGDRDAMAAQLDDIFASDGESSRAAASGGSFISGTFILENVTKINYTSIAAVRYFYNIINFNFLMVFLAIPFAMKALFHTCFGLVMRIYNVIILFVISPPLIALMPLDGGNAYKGWRQKFIGNVISAYGTVAGLNLFFQILPLVNEIEFFETNNPATKITMGFYNALAQLLFVLVGCYMIQDISKMISGFIGAEDAQASGEGMAKKIGEKAKKAGMAAVAVAGLAVGGGAAVVSKLAAGAAKAAGGGSDEAAEANEAKPSKHPKLAKVANGLGGGLGGFLGKKAGVGIYNKIGNRLNKNAISDMGGEGSSGDSPVKSETKPKENGSVVDKVAGGEGKKSSGSAPAKDESAKPVDKKAGDEVKEGNSNPAEGTEAQSDVVDKYVTTSRNSYIHSQRGIELAKNLGIQLIAGTGMGKAMNEMTGGMFKVFGGKGINQMDGAISSKTDLNEQMMYYYNKDRKKEKQKEQEIKMGDLYEVMQAANQRKVNTEMMVNNIKNSGQTMIDHVELREDSLNRLANVFAQVLSDKNATSDQRENAKSEFISGMQSMGFDQESASNIAKAMMDSGAKATFLASADENGTINCQALNADGATISSASASQRDAATAIKGAMQEAISSVTSKVRIDDQGKANDDFIKNLTKNLTVEQQKQVGGKTALQMNEEMRRTATGEKSERGDIKAILKILQSKL